MGPTILATLIAVLVVVAPWTAAAQVNMQLSGTVESVEGTTLTLVTTAPPKLKVTLGTSYTPPAGPPPKLVVDLDEVPASQWVFLRPGERIAVVGVPSATGRFAAIAIIGGAGPPRQPQAP